MSWVYCCKRHFNGECQLILTALYQINGNADERSLVVVFNGLQVINSATFALSIEQRTRSFVIVASASVCLCLPFFYLSICEKYKNTQSHKENVLH